MRFEIMLSPQASAGLAALRAPGRAEVEDRIETHLRHEPEKTSRSRIKRLRGIHRPQYRLRVGGVRVYYDVAGERVEILAVMTKEQALRWLRGEKEER